MPQTNKDVLTTFEEELAFSGLGGYRSRQQAAWHPQFVFEDSPTCLNPRNLGKRVPSSHGALMEFVPDGSKQERFPCRQYWLKKTIADSSANP
jgi:hypothetical protein